MRIREILSVGGSLSIFLMDYRVFFFIIIIVFKHFYLFIVIVIYLIITSVYRMRICNVSYYFQNYERR